MKFYRELKKVWKRRKKLKGAVYHLRRMKALYSKNDEEFIYELEAFLCKARSVLDTMLEDYMGISKKEKLRPYSFEEKAKELQISKHLEFIKP